MKSIFVVVAFCLALAYAQPTNTNPAGEDYFAPSLVWSLPLNTTVNGTLINSTDYAQFYWVWIPFNVAGVRYTVNNTNDVDCDDYVELHIDFVEPEQDSTVSFPCTEASSSAFCDSYDAYIDAYEGSNDWSEYDVYSDFRPGKWHLVTVGRYYDSGNDCPYYLRVESTNSCPSANYTVTVDYYATPTGCIANSNIQNVTASGQSFTKTFTAIETVDAYRVDVPQNVSRVWAWVQSTVGSLNLYAAAGYISTDYYYSDDYDESGYSNSNGIYTYLVELALPDGDYPVFFSVEATSTLGDYNISVYWSACGALTAGYGEIGYNYNNATNFWYIPDCSDPVVYNNISILNANQDLSFNLPAYNSSVDSDYSAAYAYISVPAGTVGAINFTCNSTTSNTFLTFTKGGFTDCYNYYTEYVSCSYPGFGTSDYLYLLSNDLFVGGYWSIAACNGQSVSNSIVTITTAGSISAAPSASPSPGSVPSASSSPAASSSSGEDSSVSATVFPALLMIVLAAIIAF